VEGEKLGKSDTTTEGGEPRPNKFHRSPDQGKLRSDHSAERGAVFDFDSNDVRGRHAEWRKGKKKKTQKNPPTIGSRKDNATVPPEFELRGDTR